MPDDLKQQIEALLKIIPLLGVPCLSANRYEADDIIAQMAREMQQHNDAQLLIYSSDKDLMQLVGKNVFTMAGDRQNRLWTKMDAHKVEEKYGVPPEKIVDYLALIGDKSDNIPGVLGIGKVTASKLLKTYDSLESIYQNIEKISGSVKKKLQDGHDAAFSSRKLIALDHELDGIASLEKLKMGTIDKEEVEKWLTHYECTALLKKISPKHSLLEQTEEQDLFAVEKPSVYPFDFVRKDLKSIGDVDEMVAVLQKQPHFTFDLETTSLDALSAQIIAISFAFTENKKNYSFYVHFNEDLDFFSLKKLHELFRDEKVGKIGHNLKYEYSVLKSNGIALNGMVHDTMLYEYLLSAGYNRLGLKDLCFSYFDYAPLSYEELTKEEGDLKKIDAEKLREYSLQDSEITQCLFQKQIGRLSKKEVEVFNKIEMPLVSVLGNMELGGVLIDPKYLKNLEREYEAELAQTEKEIYKLAGRTFNISSTKQLKEVLFDELNITPLKKKKTGFSTDHSVLQQLAKEHPIAATLLVYRKYDKLLNTYVRTLPTLIHPKTKRVHTSYNQAITATGRLSSNQPNLQNIPTAMEDGKGLRGAFCAPENMKMVSIDYSQVELRVLAFLSKDEVLNKAYLENQDIHRKTASLLFDKKEDEVTSKERNIAKTINFSIIYGAGPHSLAKGLSISYEEAQKFVQTYRDSYAGVTAYMHDLLKEAREKLSVSTYFGRKRSVNGIVSKDFQTRMRDERIAFNTVIQGTASDIIKLAMIKIDNAIEQKEISCEMVMQVHDELVFYVPEKEVETTVPKLAEKIINIPPFNSILKADASVGDHWSK
uniref:DNA-directed DNA polymerase n=1 Tax=Magallana gigas TaxID=29159 RepID=K1Q5L6_MAGGI|eukprot:XP_011445110.1 PREDICTED: uncharacterized protein LOC105340639 [Crassostrea gigas]